MKWKLKKSIAKGAKSPCVIKVTKANLTGAFMDLNNLGAGEFSYSPESVGIYRVMHNFDRAEKAIKGCYLVYELDGENFLRYKSLPDDQVRNVPPLSMIDADHINNLGAEIRAQYL